jgi:hypothetical protein
MKTGQATLRRVRSFPVETTCFNDETALLGEIEDIPYAQEGILKMRRNHGKIFRIEGDEFQEVHGSTSLLLSFVG